MAEFRMRSSFNLNPFGKMAIVLMVAISGLCSAQEGTGSLVLRLIEGTGPAAIKVDGVAVGSLSSKELTLKQTTGDMMFRSSDPASDSFRQRVNVNSGDVSIVDATFGSSQR